MKLKLKARVKYLASIFAGTGTKVRKDGLAAYVDLDYLSLAPLGDLANLDTTGKIIAVQDTTTGQISSAGFNLGYGGSSASSVTIGLGSKTFVTQPGLEYQVGARVRVSSRANPNNFMEGIVTSYVGRNFTINSLLVGGSGTYADWSLNIAGEAGTGALVSFLTREYTLGDSMTFNGGYQTQLQTDLGALFQVVNMGIGGEGSGQLANRYINDLITPGDGHGATTLIGVNDLIVCDLYNNSFGRTLANVEAAVKADLQAMYTAQKAAGIRVRAVTILPFGTFTEALGGAVGIGAGSGTIAPSTGSPTITGTGTHFISEGFKAGMKLKRYDGVVIGTLASDPASETSMTLTGNAAVTVTAPNNAPYKNVEWTAAKEVIRNNINTWILNTATSVDDRINADFAMRDPAHTERLLPANVSADGLHPSVAGYTLLGHTIFLGGSWPVFSVPLPKVEITKAVVRSNQDTRTTDIVRFGGISVGRDNNAIAVANFRSNSNTYPRAEQPMQWFEQPNANGYGWLVRVGDDAILKWSYVINGVEQPTKFRLDPTAGGPDFVSDTLAFRSRTTTFDGASGVAQKLEPYSVSGTLAGFVRTTYAAGGSAFGVDQASALRHEFQIAGVTKFVIGTAGQLNGAYFPVYADNTAAAVLTPGDFYRTSTGVVMVRF